MRWALMMESWPENSASRLAPDGPGFRSW